VADTTSIQTLFDGDARTIIKIVGVSDGTGLAASLLVDVSILRGAPTQVNIERIEWDISGLQVEILFDGLSWQDACEKEKEFISLYGRIDKHNGILVNLTDGGDGAFGVIMSEERKKQISELAKGNKSRTGQKTSEETKKKMSEAQKGLKRKPFTEQGWENFMKARISTRGRKQSIEEIENRRKSLIGIPRTQEWKDKISKANKGKTMSEEAKKKMSDYWKGRKRKPMSEETKRKIGEANRKKNNL